MPTNNPKPRTPAQIEASRRNGARSHGPKSAEGRSRSSQNARTHGLTAQTNHVLSSEDSQTFNHLLDSYIRAYMPADQAEHQFVLEIARCAWRLDRIGAIEASLFNLKVEDQRRQLRGRSKAVSPADRIALAFAAISDQSQQLQLVCRYESTCRRGLLVATSALARIQNDRRRCPHNSQDPDSLDLQNEPERVRSDRAISLRPISRQGPAAARVPFGFPSAGSAEVSLNEYPRQSPPAHSRHQRHVQQRRPARSSQAE